MEDNSVKSLIEILTPYFSYLFRQLLSSFISIQQITYFETQ